MPREILRITPEATYGTFNSGGTHTIIDLPADDAFTMRVAPNFWEIASAASDNLITTTGTATANIDGELQIYGRPSQSALLASMVAGVTGSACPTLPSFTIDHAIFIEDGSCTPKYRRYLGVMCDGGFDLTNDAQGVLMLWKLKLMGATPATITGSDFATPTYSAYDYAEAPFTFQNAHSTIVYKGSDISDNVESLSYAAGNILMPFRGAGQYRSKVKYCGRRPTITMGTLYYTQQQRIDYEANTAVSLAITFTDPLVDTLVLTFGNTNYLRTVTDKTKIADFHRQTIMLRNTMDPATGTDMSIVYTPHV